MARVISIRSRVQDEATKSLAAQAAAVRKVGDEGKKASDALVKASERIERAKKAELSASKQVEHAVRMEAAAGKPLEQQLLRLEHEYQTLEVRMRAMVRVTGEVDQSMASQAATARRSADALRDQMAAPTRDAADAAREHAAAMARQSQIANQVIERFIGVEAAFRAISFVLRELTENSAQFKGLADDTGRLVDNLTKAATSGERFTNAMVAARVVVQAMQDVEAEEGPGFLEAWEQNARSALPMLNAALTAVEAVTGAIARSEAGQAIKNEIVLDPIDVVAEAEKIAAARKSAEAEANKLLLEERRKFQEQITDLELEFTGKALSEVMLAKRREAALQAAQEEAARLDEREAQLAEHVERVLAIRDRERQAELALQESVVRAQDRAITERERKIQGEAATSMAAADQIGGAFGAMFASIATQTGTTEDAFKQMGRVVLQQIMAHVTAAISAYAAEAAAAAAASTAPSGPAALVAGPALAAGVAAMVSGIGMALLSMNEGGLVPMHMGRPGEDSVPAMLTPGEMVIDAETTRRLQRVLARSGGSGAGFANGGVVQAGGAPVLNVNVVFNSLQKPGRREADEVAAVIGEALERRARQGKYNPRTR